MNLIALGINHNTASVEVRERVAFSPNQAVEALQAGVDKLPIEEMVLLSTCNRTEIYVIPKPETQFTNLVSQLLSWMADFHNLPVIELREAAYSFDADEAVKHIIQVAAGLDSMVLGEPQIFGQLKSAFSVGIEVGSVGTKLQNLFPKLFSVAKKVRSDTAIGENPVSVAYAAVNLANRIFADLATSTVMLVGAGETIELVAQHLVETGITNIVIANRTLSRAKEVGEKFSAKAILLSEIPDELCHADIVITSTGSQLPILGKGAVEQALRVRKRRPVLMIDIAVPRDIEAQVGDLRDVYLYTIDDLSDIVEANIQNRRSEISKADEIIAAGLERLIRDTRSLGAIDTVKAYRQMAESIQNEELKKAQKNISRGEDPELVLSQFARSLTNKLIHVPTAKLKQASSSGRLDLLANAREILGLDKQKNLQDLEDPDSEKSEGKDVSSPIRATQTLQ